MNHRGLLSHVSREIPEAPRLLHVTTIPGSLWSFLRGQVGYMRAQGYEVHALSSPGYFLDKFAESEAVACHKVAMSRRIAPLSDMVSLVRVVGVVRRIRPHIVHAHTPKAGLLGMMSAWLLRVPVRVYEIHGLPYMTARGPQRALLKLVERVACRLATHVVCVGPSMRRVAASELCAPAKVRLLERGSANGVDAQFKFDPTRYDLSVKRVRERLGIPAGSLVVGFVGRLVRDKGIQELMRAWQILSLELPSAHLLLVGPFEDGDGLPEETRAEIENDPRVHTVGLVDEAAEYYRVMDLLVLPSFREGLPYSPLEAAAMRLPVVATRIPGCVDAVHDGITGLLVPAGDVPALVEAIETYARDPELRRCHGDAGRERVLRDFTPSEVWRAVEGLYRDALTGTAPRQPAMAAPEVRK